MKSKFLNTINSLVQYERYYFYAFTLINLLPIYLFETFPTVDGPAHLYNSRLVLELLTDKTDDLAQFFIFNKGLIPNWLGHGILSGLMLFLPALVAEKIVLTLYLLFLPIAFRFLSNQLSNERRRDNFVLYLIFPFTYSFLFFFGFYNFHLGMVLLFMATGLWVKYAKANYHPNGLVLLLSILALLIYFAHLFVFALFVGIVVYSAGVYLWKSPRSEVPYFHLLKALLFILLPGCVLSAVYLLNHEIITDDHAQLTSFSESWSMIQSVAPARGIEYGKEAVFTKWIFFVLIAIVGNLILSRLKHLTKAWSTNSIIWGGISLVLLVAYFILPKGSLFVSDRILVFFFLFLILFIRTQRLNIWLSAMAFMVVNYVNVSLLSVYVKSTKESNALTHTIVDAAEHIKPYSTVLPVNESNYWLLAHASNYLGINKPLVILENYEASTHYFPLQWNFDQMPLPILGDRALATTGLTFNENRSKIPIDYVLIISDLGNPTTKGAKEKEIDEVLSHYYQRCFTDKTNTIKLYKRLLN